MDNFKMRANICTYFKNGDPLVSSAQKIVIFSEAPGLDGPSLKVRHIYTSK